MALKSRLSAFSASSTNDVFPGVMPPRFNLDISLSILSRSWAEVYPHHEGEAYIREAIRLIQSQNGFLSQVTNVVKPRFRVSIDPGMLTWRLGNARFAIRADEMTLQTVRNFAKGVSGSFTIEVIVTPTPTLRKPSFNVRIRLTCVSSPGGFHLSDTENVPSADDTADVTGDGFQHTAEICLQNLGVVNEGMENAKRSYDDGEPVAKRSRMDDHAVGSTERRINEEICNCLLQAFADMVMEKLNGGLPLQSLHTDDSSDWLFDFSELSMPEFQNGFLASKYSSALRYRDETIQTPTTVRGALTYRPTVISSPVH